MKKIKKGKDHPEVRDIKNICDVSGNSKTTKNVCDKVKNKKNSKDH